VNGSLHVTFVQISKGLTHPLLHPRVAVLPHVTGTHTAVFSVGANLYVPHPQVYLLLAPYELLLSCSALFACDALAERLGVSGRRRAVLGIVEGVLLWNVSVLWGHPEDAVALAFVLYALVFAFDQRWTGTGWLFGAAFAMQPLVVLTLPVLLVMGGRRRVLGLLARGILPAAAVTLPSLATNFHATVHILTTQPTWPASNHRTPWTGLAPVLTRAGPNTTVGGGPVRIVAFVLAATVGWWTRRWRSAPDMITWAVALSLALRCYTESVMTDYYVWPALAVGVIAAARRSTARFSIAVVFAIVTTVTAQWKGLPQWPWWIIDIAGMTGVLVVSSGSTTDGRQSVSRPYRSRASMPL
jgi:hypothetical protein